MEFINEITESRIFRQLSVVDGMSSNSMALRVLNYLLALKTLYYENESEAKAYAQSMVNYQSYTGFRTNLPDLYNVLVLIINHDTYSDKITGPEIQLPEMRIKRTIRMMAAGKLDERDYNELLLMILRRISGTDSIHWRMRRRLTKYSSLLETDRAQHIQQLMRLLRHKEHTYPDLYVLLQNAAAKNKLTV